MSKLFGVLNDRDSGQAAVPGTVRLYYQRSEDTNNYVSTLILTRRDVADLLSLEEVMGVVEQAFKDYAAGLTQLLPKVYVQLEKGDFRAMPCAVPGAAGVKWVNVHLGNHEIGLPSIMAVIIISDPDTGYPLAIMDGTGITAYRTASTSAIASKYLARRDSHTLGLIGAGRQGYMHLQSHDRIFSIDTVKVFDLSEEAAKAFVKSFPNRNVTASSAADVAVADIVCTVTPSTSPVISASWIKPGTHINAVGADAPGKQELDPAILKMARVVVDDVTQACHGGEINVAISKGIFEQCQVWGTLADVIAGTKTGRASPEDVTVFDSTGLAIEDMATARLVYEKAKKRTGYMTLEIV